MAWDGGRRSRICPPWKVLLTVDPLERRVEGVEEEEAAEAPAMLCVEGEAGGRRWDKELERGEEGSQESFQLVKELCSDLRHIGAMMSIIKTKLGGDADFPRPINS